MQDTETASAWRLYLLNWLALAAAGAALLCGIIAGGFSITLMSSVMGFGFVAIYAAFAVYNAKAAGRGDPQVVFVLGGMAQIVLVTIIMTPFTYVAAAPNFPMQDSALLAMDRALGLDWMAYLTFLHQRPLLSSWVDFGYTMIKWPLFLIPVALAARHDYVRIQQHTLAFLIALVVTVIISAFVPALGTFAELGLKISDYSAFGAAAYESQLADLPAVRDGTLRALDLGSLSGIVTFPSFHAASAALYLWALWPVKWLRPVTVLANAAMLAATPIVGGHYFVDIFAGIAVAAGAIAVAGIICRRIIAAVSVPALTEAVAAPG